MAVERHGQTIHCSFLALERDGHPIMNSKKCGRKRSWLKVLIVPAFNKRNREKGRKPSEVWIRYLSNTKCKPLCHDDRIVWFKHTPVTDTPGDRVLSYLVGMNWWLADTPNLILCNIIYPAILPWRHMRNSDMKATLSALKLRPRNFVWTQFLKSL